MRGAQVHPGGGLFPDRTEMVAQHLDTLVYQANDQHLWTPDHHSVLDYMRAEGYKIGILRNTRNAEWPDSPTDPTALGAKLSQDITDLGQDGKQCFGVLDHEGHDADSVMASIRGFRIRRPGRFLYWTMEPKQFAPSWMTPGLVGLINTDSMLWIIIQLYRAHMEPVSEMACIEQAMMAGVRRGKILCYYDRYEEDMNGLVYDYANAR